jgi:hypothetical protein
MRVRAKFTVTSVEEPYPGAPESTRRVVLAPQYDPDLPEDRRYHQSTPQGEIWMQVDNPSATKEFKPGRQFYVDFTAVSEAS